MNASVLYVCMAALAAAPAAPADGLPRIRQVGAVAPDILAVTIDAGEVEHGRQVPHEPREGDQVDPGQHRWVRRGGKLIGALAGAEGRILYTFDRLAGEPLDVARAERAQSWRVTCPRDAHYADGAAPRGVYRKTKPTDLARTGPWQFEAPLRHVLYFRLPAPLTAGREYTVTLEGSKLATAKLLYDPSSAVSAAVHVSHVGFRPDDPAKVAFLSCWMGSGGGLAYREGLAFRVLDHATGRSVFQGRTKLSKAATARDEDAYKTNHNGTDVYEMDFSPLARPGIYRVSVEGVGCSPPFRVDPDVWRGAFVVSARGFYHQRSGVALGPPYTTYRRPRCFHPADGVKVYASKAALMDTGNGLTREGSNFGNLVQGKSDGIVPNAWGGYMDAGDWDRRIQHLEASRLLLELAGMFGDYFAKLPLNIPESSNALPDVVDEAMFNLDCYRRMQTPQGGIRGGIESSEHPRYGEASWQESLTVLAYAPGVWSSYVYAGVAARAAGVLEALDAGLADTYRKSALAAMTWAEAQLKGMAGRKLPHAVNDARNLAAAELFRLTGEKRWHDVFVQTTAITTPQAGLFVWQDHDQPEAPWVYVRTRRPGMDERLRENCRRALLREADDRVAQCGKTAFRWTKYPWRPTGTGSLTAPDAVHLIRAHVLTGDAKYLRAAVLACQTGLGANPLNLCYTTGLGHESPRHPLHVDSRVSDQAPPPGLTVFGPVDPSKMKQDWAEEVVARFCHPARDRWPIIEGYWDVFWYPLVCEYTIHEPMARNAYAWGYLAGREVSAAAAPETQGKGPQP